MPRNFSCDSAGAVGAVRGQLQGVLLFALSRGKALNYFVISSCSIWKRRVHGVRMKSNRAARRCLANRPDSTTADRVAGKRRATIRMSVAWRIVTLTLLTCIP